ncbi:Uncharacterised protein [Mycobacteroides abscessus subsp. abscessus]|nr:hypothetical protein [Mycobacteroides abscessus]SID25589.1 Uncharacterised protein [Mycobacteroides abscessus subsp. abscessus]CPW03062.1 Uncharacterised protein [Mycobacteroides abscessus]SIJ26435.1 Uncharacterised protein [Mycobacteroides abscessus subsp. abscessus]SIJ49908.1 Uncharacterised protein [Mycobacteroides abscessus subsp. abscessus]
MYSQKLACVVGVCWGVSSLLALTTVNAAADPAPPGFPDLGAYTQVNTADYPGTSPRDRSPWFQPPSGHFRCNLGASTVGCSGEIPGVDSYPLSRNPGQECESVHIASGSVVRRQSMGCGYHQWGGNPGQQVLNPGQKIVSGSATCVAGEDDYTACIISGTPSRGFVISRGGTWTF